MKVNFFTAQLKLWTGIFNYKGTSTPKEYWFAFIFHVILGFLGFLNLSASAVWVLFANASPSYNTRDLAMKAHYVFLVIGAIILLYVMLSFIPWIALTVRRLRDAGKSGWWTLLLLFFGFGQIILLFLCASGSLAGGIAFNPETNVPEAIYGPPEFFYEPEINQNEDYYGPPLFDIEPDDNDYDPSDNIPEPVYGPHEDNYDPDVNQNEDVYGPPAFDLEPYDDDYDPEENYQPTLYGPPPFDMDEDNYGPVDVEE